MIAEIINKVTYMISSILAAIVLWAENKNPVVVAGVGIILILILYLVLVIIVSGRRK